MITAEFLTKIESLSVLPEFIQEIFNIDKDRVSDQLIPMFKILKDDIKCFVEYPYVDKFYRDSYYSFFSKKHNSYNRNSVRISFFDDKINVNDFFHATDCDDIEKHFLGFISIRPTTYRLIGHSFISPKALINNNFVCCLSKTTASINGRKLSVHGFPYCSQDNESFTCSEVVIINIVDYFAHKYPEYASILPSQVAKILSKHTYQRQLPAHGQPTENISFVLKKLGFGTVVYSCSESGGDSIYGVEDFKDLLYIYIESGIPVIATMSLESKSHHAVLVIGRIDSANYVTIQKKSMLPNSSRAYEFTKAYDQLLIMNDNRPPYAVVNFNQPIQDSNSGKYYEFKSFIIPLYQKVHIDAYQFKQFFFVIVESLEKGDGTDHVKFTKKGIDYTYRFFLTSSKSYKNYIALSVNLSDDFKTLIIDKAMPKFIWVGEIIPGNKYDTKQLVESVIVVDATESGLTDHLIFATNSRYLIIRKSDYFHFHDSQNTDNKKYMVFEFQKEKFYTFTNNLKGEHTKWKN